MKAFITGSRAYGTPREDSDIDLVIAASASDLFLLWENKDEGKGLRFGKLNLVTFNLDNPEDVERYEKWKAVHNDLVSRKPVTKDEAIKCFREAGAEHNYTAEKG